VTSAWAPAGWPATMTRHRSPANQPGAEPGHHRILATLCIRHAPLLQFGARAALLGLGFVTVKTVRVTDGDNDYVASNTQVRLSHAD
jgi:hypothetical protein